jgi:heme exporter protein D
VIDTTGPFHAAYGITAVVLIVYSVSIWRRAARLSAQARERLREAPLR